MIVLRYATNDELHGHVRTTWLDALLPSKRQVPRYPRAPRRGDWISIPLARRALELVVDDLLDTAEVIVAELDSVPGELLGWTVFDDAHVHFVRVISGYGRSGLGTVLLQRAGAEKPPSYLTSAGQALLDAVRSKAQVTHAR